MNWQHINLLVWHTTEKDVDKNKETIENFMETCPYLLDKKILSIKRMWQLKIHDSVLSFT